MNGNHVASLQSISRSPNKPKQHLMFFLTLRCPSLTVMRGTCFKLEHDAWMHHWQSVLRKQSPSRGFWLSGGLCLVDHHHRVFQPQVKAGHCRSDSICVLLVVDSVHVCIAQATAWLQRKRSWEGDGVNDRREKAWMWSTCLVTLYDLRNKSRFLETLVIAVIREHNDRKVRE